MDRFILIDGNAIIHRAFHALPPLTSSDGQIANAVYGFFSMFLKIQEDFQPTYIAVCFDRPKPTFRQEMFVGYQAKRPKMSDDLPPQIVKVHEVLEAGKVPIFEVDGYEADDLIGTLATQAVRLSGLSSQLSDSGQSVVSKSETDKQRTGKQVAENRKQKTDNRDIEVIIVSGDRDLLQLVNPHVKVCTPVVGLTKNVLYDEVLVEEKYGIKPAQFIDYKALVGDNSDNYPGVSGIGPKTAADLIRKFETFENLYKNLGELPEKVALRLATDAEQAALAKKLATIVTDAPITLDIDSCSLSKFDKKGFILQLDILGFQSLVKRAKGEPVIRVSKVPARNASQSEAGGSKGEDKQDEKKDDEQLGLL